MRYRQHSSIAAIAAVAVALLVGLAACGGSSDDTTVVRVGDRTITKAMVDRWDQIVRHGAEFTAFRGEPRGGTVRQRALAVLIADEWLIGEAAREGAPAQRSAVAAALAERTQGQAGIEFHERLASTGQDVAGYKLELEAELALEAIRRNLARRSNQITPADITAFYEANHTQFDVAPEARVVDIVEHLPSPTAAVDFVRRVGIGARFTQRAYHKELILTPGVLSGPAYKKKVDYAIFAARPGVVSQPMRFGDGWAVFVVRRIVPARTQPLAKVRATVLARLRVYRTRQLRLQFEAEFLRRWTATTHCSNGYVVPGCARYRGALGPPEDRFSSED